jgi:ribosome recycling factor
MQPTQIIKQLEADLESSFNHFQEELSRIRTGRANASVLDKVMVKAYGVMIPLKQVANVTAPEAQLIQVTPFDSSNLQAIASAIREDQSLGLNPVDDGIVIRLTVPPLTTERRTAIVKQLGEIAENGLIAMRNYRHEILKEAENAKKTRSITEDDYKSIQKQADELMTKYKNKVDIMVESKEQEIMTI